jgi:hypothetical protein
MSDESVVNRFCIPTIKIKGYRPYKGTIDAPLILGNSNYTTIAQRCPQCFKPFVEYLESLLLI